MQSALLSLGLRGIHGKAIKPGHLLIPEGLITQNFFPHVDAIAPQIVEYGLVVKDGDGQIKKAGVNDSIGLGDEISLDIRFSEAVLWQENSWQSTKKADIST